MPAGRIESAQREFTVVATTDVSTREQFDNMIVANVGGYPVRIRDVADVQVGAVDERVISRYNGKPSLNIGVIKQAVANPLDLSKALRAEVAKINPTLPPGMSSSSPTTRRCSSTARSSRCSRRSPRRSCWSCW